jgi:hypothetical protein
MPVIFKQRLASHEAESNTMQWLDLFDSRVGSVKRAKKEQLNVCIAVSPCSGHTDDFH